MGKKQTTILEALLMCASHCQGGHSAAGMAAADALYFDFPVTMEKLVCVAIAHDLSPDDLWPWLRKMNPELLAKADQAVEDKRAFAERVKAFRIMPQTADAK